MKHACLEVKTDNEMLVERCFHFLSNTQTVLWGSTYTVHDPEQRQKAAVWLAAQIEGVLT